MPTKHEIIANVYKTDWGSGAQALDWIKSEDKQKLEADPEYEKSGIGNKDVDEWFLNKQLAHLSIGKTLQGKFKLLRGTWSKEHFSGWCVQLRLRASGSLQRRTLRHHTV